jgi:hypothetical protein
MRRQKIKFNSEQMMQLGFKRDSDMNYSQEIVPSDLFFFAWLHGKLARRFLFQLEVVFRAVIETPRNLTPNFVESIFEG